MAAALTAPGCNIVAPLVVFIAGPGTVEPEHRLDASRSAVVLVEDPESRMPVRSHRLALIQAMEKRLLEKGLVGELVDGQQALRLADADTSGGRMPVSEIGKRLHADQVVWVTIDSFIRADMTQNIEPRIALRVRVIDSAADAVVYPADPAGRMVVVSDSARRGSVSSATGAQNEIERKLAEKAGRAVVQLFYEYEVPQRLADTGT
jgi:hypothetical protein